MGAAYWYAWAIVAMVLAGTSSFVLRLAIENGANSDIVRLAMHTTVLLGSLLAVLWQGEFALASPMLDGDTTLIAVLQGSLFFFSVYLRFLSIEKKAPSFVVFCLYQFKVLPVILISLVFFDEFALFLDIPRIVGLILALISIVTVLELEQFRYTRGNPIWAGISIAVFGMIVSAAVVVVSKFAVTDDPRMSLFAYMFVVNAATVFWASLFLLFSKPQGQKTLLSSSYYGSVMGLLTFISFYCLLRALRDGPLSQVASISALGIFVPIILASIFLGEKLKRRVEAGIFLAVAALIAIG